MIAVVSCGNVLIVLQYKNYLVKKFNVTKVNMNK